MHVTLREVSRAERACLRAWFADELRDVLSAVPVALRESTLELQWTAKNASIEQRGAVDRMIYADGRPVGRIAVAREDAQDTLVDILIDPAQRGRGLGRAALECVQAESGDLDRSLVLHVRHGSPAARLYARLGFEVVGASALDLEMRWDPPPRSQSPRIGARVGGPASLPTGYLPVAVEGSGLRARVRFVDVGDSRLDDPFFGDAVGRAKRTDAEVCTLTLEELLSLPVEKDALSLTGLVFHVSRCGSSLVMRAAQADPSTFGVAEADAIDSVLCRLELDDETRVTALRALVHTLARRREPRAQRLILKLDAWHLARHELLCRAFPEVPKLLVLRGPEGVLASHRVRRGSHMVPGLMPSRVLALNPNDRAPGDLDGYGCLVLRSLYEHAQALLTQSEVRAVDYGALHPDTQLAAVCYLGGTVHGDLIREIHERARSHAKHRHQIFDPTSDRERELHLPPPLRARIEAELQPLYRALMERITAGERAIASSSGASAAQSSTR